jgi:outer membrane protein OmpA-like peptidoglycan-associated protein
MKYILLSVTTSLLVLALLACDGPGSKVARTSAAGEADATRQEQQSGADRRAPSEPSTGRERAPLDYGSKLTVEVSDLQGLITDLQGRVTDREIIIELPSDVLFDFDNADIRPDAFPTLEKLARLIKQSGAGVIQVNGHTDSIGSDAYNLALSKRRVASVATWLTIDGGIGAGRLEARGFGKTRPVAANRNPDGSDNPEGRQKNRRVEVIIPRK